MQLDQTILTKRKETIHYCESFRYGGNDALDKRFYRSNEVSVPAESGSSILIMGFSITSPYNGLFKSPLVDFSHQGPIAKHK
jgi:hypothetical protein